jgi:hypothetical protein
MTLNNYIRRRSHDDVACAEFDCNPNFFPNDILHDVMISYLMLVHVQEAMETVVLVGWISYMIELQIV